MDEDRFSPAVALFHQRLNDAVRDRATVPARGSRVKLEAIRTFIEQLPRDRGRIGRLGHARQLDSLVRHETKSRPGRRWGNLHQSGCRVTSRKHRWPCGADPRTRHFARLDAIAQLARVLQRGPDVEHARKPILREHHLKLAGEVGRRDLCGIGPHSFQEVDVAVPEAGRNRRSGRVDDVDPSRYAHGRPAPHGHDLAAIDQDGAVADGFLSGAGINRPTDHCELGIGVSRLTLGAGAEET